MGRAPSAGTQPSPSQASAASQPAAAAEPAPAPASPSGTDSAASAPESPARGISRRAIWVLAAATGAILLAAALVGVSRWLLSTDPVSSFVETHPGQYPQPDAPSGYPWWLNWAHFFNMFLMVLVIRTGLQIRSETRPEAYWRPRWNPERRISLTIWTHQALDLLWLLNGLVFVVLLFTTGYWTRIVPTSWEVFPNALSAGLQYASLDWPTHHDWAHYNSLQELAYFTTVFIAAPLAVATGVRLSGLWPSGSRRLSTLYPAEVARRIHLPVMVYFLVFIAVHVLLVFATGALRNLNQIYAGQDAENWTGFWLFALSLLVIIGGVLAVRPMITAPIASLFGKVGR